MANVKNRKATEPGSKHVQEESKKVDKPLKPTFGTVVAKSIMTVCMIAMMIEDFNMTGTKIHLVYMLSDISALFTTFALVISFWNDYQIYNGKQVCSRIKRVEQISFGALLIIQIVVVSLYWTLLHAEKGVRNWSISVECYINGILLHSLPLLCLLIDQVISSRRLAKSDAPTSLLVMV